MKKLVCNPFAVFFLVFALIAIPLCIFPINLFSGEIHYENGLGEFVVDAPLSLSYFFGLGMNEGDTIGLKSFNLTISGYLTAFIFLIGIPGLVAYRIYLGSKSNSTNKPIDS